MEDKVYSLKDEIKMANKVVKEGIKLLPDDAKSEFKAMRGDIFIDEAIENAEGVLNDNDEKATLLKAYAIQQANVVVSALWRLQLLPEDLEKEYRALPTLEASAKSYNRYVNARKERLDKVMDEHNAIMKEEKDLDIFKGIINGMKAKDAEKEYDKMQQNAQQAMQR